MSPTDSVANGSVTLVVREDVKEIASRLVGNRQGELASKQDWRLGELDGGYCHWLIELAL